MKIGNSCCNYRRNPGILKDQLWNHRIFTTAGADVRIHPAITFVRLVRLEYVVPVMSIWYYISTWLHIAGATFWIGGMLFFPLVLLPAIKNNHERSQLLMATGLKFRFYGYIVLAMMLVTGFLNMYFKDIQFSWKFFNETHYGQLVIIKIILFFSLVLISLTHDLVAGKKILGQMQKEQKAKLKLINRWTGRILLLISLIMVYIGVLLSRIT